MSPWRTIVERTRAEHARFRADLEDVERAQRRVLRRILAANAESVLGRRCAFCGIRDADEFRERVPIHTYDDLEPHVRASLDAAGDGLTCEPVIAWERTSGTSRAAKLVPYTESSLVAFRRALFPWLHDLAQRVPGTRRGRVYFALSPALATPARTPSGIPIGIENDAIFFGRELAAPLAALTVAPDGLVRGGDDAETWRYRTLRALVEAEDLSLVSIWSPTFLSALFDGADALAERLAGDLTRSGARPARVRTVRAALSRPEPDLTALWPRLALMSCWTHGSSARFLPALERALPGVAVQGKGLIATEGVVSLPLVDVPFPVLAVNSGFFEFIDCAGCSLLGHELDIGARYRVVMTTPGGLYRYDIGDSVRVRGYHLGAPQLEFVGRDASTSDLCGEKLSDAQVEQCLEGEAGFALLAPCLRARPRYRLVVDAAERDELDAGRLAARVECRLRGNPHYDYARRLGQLAPVAPARRRRALSAWLRALTAQGRRLGDIKPPALYGGLDWENLFDEP